MSAIPLKKKRTQLKKTKKTKKKHKKPESKYIHRNCKITKTFLCQPGYDDRMSIKEGWTR